MSKKTYFFPIGPGVDAEVTIEVEDGDVLPEHVSALGRYLAIYFEALGGVMADAPKQLEAPKKKRTGCSSCGRHARAREHLDGTCTYTPLKREQAAPDVPDDDGEDPDDDADYKPLITQESTADVLTRRPYIGMEGVLHVDVEHSAVSYESIEGRYTVLHPGTPGTDDAGHVHEYQTGKDANIAHETFAACTADGCQRTIMIIEESSVGKEGGT